MSKLSSDNACAVLSSYFASLTPDGRVRFMSVCSNAYNLWRLSQDGMCILSKKGERAIGEAIHECEKLLAAGFAQQIKPYSLFED